MIRIRNLQLVLEQNMICLVTLTALLSAGHAARIFSLYPMPSISHQIVYQPIWKELSLRGHQVTVITTNPIKDATLVNLTEIDIGFVYQYIDEDLSTMEREQSHWDLAYKVSDPKQEMFYDTMFNYPPVANLLNDTTQKFDLVMVESMLPHGIAFGHKYKCPVIGLTSMNFLATTHESFGNPAHPVLHPNVFTTFGDNLTFWEKIDAVLYAAWWRYLYRAELMPRYDRLMKKHCGDDMPYLGDLERNMSLVFINTNTALHGSRPYSPGVIELGGMMHIKPQKPLPGDLKSFLDEAEKGVIYFSLGSNIKSKYINEEKRNIIMETFSELPYKVLWKFENDELPNKPSNVKISKWLPQQDILGHPNIKLFITQAGLQSTEEAIYNQVPVLALPFIADQHRNAKRINEIGFGLHLDFSKLTKEGFKNSILEIINNPKYKEKTKELNDLLHDRPMTGLESAVWWTEYVIRHKGAPYFRNRVIDMPWYEYFLLDVIGFLLLIAAIATFVLYAIVKLLIRCAKQVLGGATKIKTT